MNNENEVRKEIEEGVVEIVETNPIETIKIPEIKDCCNNNKNATCNNKNGCKCNSKKRKQSDPTFIRSGYFILTENCNLRCSYCFEGGTRNTTKYMSKETAFKGIDFLFDRENKCKEDIGITFFGGEPMLCPDLMIEMLHYGYKKSRETGIKVSFSIITNGTIWNEGVERFLDTWLRYTRDIDIQLSYDGVPEIQDGNRPCACTGLKSSDLTKNAVKHYIEYYEKYGLPLDRLHTHCCIAKNSIPHIVDSYKYFREELGIVNNNFAWVIDSPWDENDLVIFDQQLALLNDYMLTRGIRKYPFKHFNEVSGCGSGRKLVAFDCDGNIYPCHRFFFYKLENRERFIYGNLYDEVQLSNEEVHNEFLAIDNKKTECTGPCQICVAENYDSTGSFYKLPNPGYDEKFMEIINFYNRQFEELGMLLQHRDSIAKVAELIEESNKINSKGSE